MTTLITPEQRQFMINALPVLKAQAKRKRQRLFYRMFPDEDDSSILLTGGSIAYARHKYPKHLEFFRAGAKYRERGFIAGNRVGKSVAGAYETSAHLTGEYPDWWEGRRFDHPIRAWAAGKSNESTRDTVMEALFGEPEREGTRRVITGTGLIPGERIGQITFKQGAPDLLDKAKIKHVSGGWSTLGIKSYQQERGAFEGTAQHLIWLDEEVPEDIYGECLIRTTTTGGIVMTTFTPLEGLTPVVQGFMPDDDDQ